MTRIDPDPDPSYDAAEQADPIPTRYRACRKCYGWGTITTIDRGYRRTQDCRHCAGTGEETR